MGNGYLGKISAIVSANTGDFKPKLDAAASDVQRFARSVQSNLSSASSQAARAFDQIWTPLQRLERSLQAAGSMKLSFKGFEGAIKGVDELKTRLAELGKRQIDINVSGTGFRTLQQLREAVGSLTSKDVGFVASLGGLEQARALRGAMTAREQERLDKFSGVSSLAQVQRAVDVVGGRGFKQASLQMRQMVPVSEQLAKPIGEAAAQFSKLSAEVQVEFGPALLRAQKGVDNLFSDIKAGATISEQRFEGVRQRVDQVVAAMGRMAEAQSLADKGMTGRELAFRSPRASDELAASSALSEKAAASPAALRELPGFAKRVEELARLRGEIAKTQASIERRAILGLDTSQAETRLRQLLKSSEDVRASVTDWMSGPGGPSDFIDVGKVRARAVDAKTAQDAAVQIDVSLDAVRRTARKAAEVQEQQRRDIADALPFVDVGKVRARAVDAKTAQDAAVQIDVSLDALRASAAVGKFSRRATPLGPGGPGGPGEPPDGTNYFSDRLERRARRMVGGDLTDATEQARAVDRVGQSIAATRSQLDSLPDGVRTAFIPAIQQATERFAALARLGPGATRQQIAMATAEAERLATTVGRASRANAFGAQFGGPGRRGVEFGLQQVELGSYAAQLQVLQRAMAGVSTTARAAATGPFNALRAAIAEAAANGTLGLRRTRREIQSLTEDAVRAAAAASGIGVGGLRRQVQRAGDVGRGGFGNVGLAIQQAAFALDDFFSVTGGLDQRMRAIGNNISQMAFILGGTKGLIAGVAFTIGTQLAIAAYKYANNGRLAEDSAKALNGTLEKQKSIVQSLAEAFRSVAADIGGRGFTGATKDAAEVQNKLDDIREKQKKRNDERNASLNTGVQETRATIVARQKELEGTSNVGRAAVFRMEIDDLRERERRQIRALRGRPAPSVDESLSELVASRARISEGHVTDVTAAAGQGAATAAVLARKREEEQNVRALAADAARLAAAGSDAEKLVEVRSMATRDLEEASATAKRERGFFGGQSYAGAAAEAEVARLQDLLNRLNAGITDSLDRMEIELTRAALTTAARMGASLAALESAVGRDAALTLRTTSELTAFVDQLQEAKQRLADAVESGDLDAANSAREEIAALNQATAAHISAANSVAAFAAALDRVSTQLISTVLGEARSAADQARRQANAAASVAGQSPAAAERAGFEDRRRRKLEADARAAEDKERGFRRQRDADVRRFEADARAGRLGKEEQELIRQRDEAQAEIDRARDAGKTVSPEAVDRRDEAQAGLDRRFEDSPAGREARTRADRFDQENAARQRREEDIRRGRDLSQSPAERAGRQLADDLRALDAEFNEKALVGPQEKAFDEFEKDRRRIVEESFRQAAPAIFSLSDSVQNALMQGPSRAALQANDVTTSQGAAELNRLLRGDDSAKNQDLVELQKQSKALDQLVAIAQQNGAPPGIFDF